jgi:hypothetical protein
MSGAIPPPFPPPTRRYGMVLKRRDSPSLNSETFSNDLLQAVILYYPFRLCVILMYYSSRIPVPVHSSEKMKSPGLPVFDM